jgi:hypothetical protein
MRDILFNTDYISLPYMLVKILVFFLLSRVLLYVIYFAFTKLLFRKNKHRREINLRLIFLWSIFAYFIVYNIYIFALFYHGIDSLHWASPLFYLGIMAQLLTYLGLIIFFFVKRRTLKKIINDKSIN